jgi:hypothetical protein
MVDNCLKTLSTPAISSQDTGIELLAENASTAHNVVTPKAARQDRENDAAPSKWEVRRSAHISALNPSAWTPAIRTNT